MSSSSSLQAQLAALNGSAAAGSGAVAHAGSSFVTSKRHEEAIGRGVNYSVQHGYAPSANSDKNVKFKASILYATASQAADIPLVTLQEQCIDAIQTLIRHDSNIHIVCPLLLTICDTNTTIATMDVVSMENILQYLGMLLGNNNNYDNNDVAEQCLYIIEFLIRKFHIHQATSKYAQSFLWLLLPYHEQYAALFHRCLQLVDLGRLQQQSYLWLRPYAVTVRSNNNNNLPPRVPRTLIAQHVVGKNPNHLLRYMCRQVLAAAALHQRNSTMMADDDDEQDDHDEQEQLSLHHAGLQHFLSWTAAIIVQGLVWLQQQSIQDSGVIKNRESVIRILAPTVLQMVSMHDNSNNNNNLGQRSIHSWGYIVASAGAETMDLSDALICQWAMAMVQNPIAQYDEAWITVLSMIMIPTTTQTTSGGSARLASDPNERLESSYLPLLLGNDNDNNNKWIGCPMPTKMVELCASCMTMASRLGRLYHTLHLEITCFIIGLIVKSVHLLITTSNVMNQQQVLQLVVSLIQHEDMRQFWKEHDAAAAAAAAAASGGDNDDDASSRLDLIASLSAWIVQLRLGGGAGAGDALAHDDNKDVMQDDDDDDDDDNDDSDHQEGVPDEILDIYHDILQALYRTNVAACERGLAHALQQASVKNSNKTLRAKRLAKLFQGIVNIPSSSNKDDSSMDMMNVDTGSDDTDEKVWQWLPPRLALEHASAAVRLTAVKRLVVAQDNEQAHEGDDDENDDNDMDDTTTGNDSAGVESVAESLLRRWSMDDDESVALAACKAVCQMLQEKDSAGFLFASFDNDRIKRLAQETLSGLYRWCESKAVVVDDSAATTILMELQATSFAIAAYVARFLSQRKGGSTNKWRQVLLEALLANLDNDNIEKDANSTITAILNAVSNAILIALGVEADKELSSSSQARKVIMLDENFLSMIENNSEDAAILGASSSGLGKVELLLRRRCIWVILSEFTQEKNLTDEKMAMYAMRLGLLALKVHDASSSDQENLIASCLLTATTALSQHASLENLPHVALSLATSCSSDKLFGSVVHHALSELVMNRRRGNAKDDDGALVVSPVSILMEASLRPNASSSAVIRLVSMAAALIASSSSSKEEGIIPVAPWLGVVPALALLQHHEPQVRAAAVSMLVAIGEFMNDEQQDIPHEWIPMRKICQAIQDKRSSAELGGAHFLASFLATCTAGKGGSGVCISLLKLCVLSAAAAGQVTNAAGPKAFKQGWLPLTVAKGGVTASGTILNELQIAGEDSFPLWRRWKFAGQPIFDGLLHMENLETEVANNAELFSLAECVVSMLKGITVVDSRVVISSGPRSGGGRARSYSVGGDTDGIQPLNPYPKDMFTAIVEILGEENRTLPGGDVLASLVVNKVLSSKSWANSIFANLARPLKKQMACAILVYSTDDDVDLPQNVFASLPLDAIEINDILSDRLDHSNELSTISILMEYIQENGERLKTTPGAEQLVKSLFNALRKLASEALYEDMEGLEFTLQTTVFALVQVAEKGKTLLERQNENMDDWVDTLMALQSVSKTSGLKSAIRFTSLRARSAALSLLTTLASCYPDTLLGYLLEAIVSAVSADSAGDSGLDGTFSAIVPVFWSHAASTNLSFGDLLLSVVSAVIGRSDYSSSESNSTIWRDLVKSLYATAPDKDEEHTASVGALVAVFLAIHKSSDATSANDTGIETAVHMMRVAPPPCQIASMLMMLRYVKDFIIELQAGDSNMEDFQILPSHRDIAAMAFHDPNMPVMTANVKLDFLSPDKRLVMLRLVMDLLRVIDDCLLFDTVKKFVKSRKGQDHLRGSSLTIWQDLLLIHSATQGAAAQVTDDGEASVWVEIASTADESRERLQLFLPVDIFLASVTSLIDDGETSDTKSRALRLVADRVLKVNPTEPEGGLYIDLIPTILELLKNESGGSSQETIVQQSALIAIEHITRSLFRASSGLPARGGSEHLVNALSCAASLVKSVQDDAKTTFASLDASARQLISTIALSAATIVRVLGTRSLPILPKLMQRMSAILSLTNAYAASCAESADEGEPLAQARLLQLSILRFLIAVTETLPQFIPHYLKTLLSGSFLLSKALRNENDTSLISAVKHLDTILPSHVPARLFVPTLTKALTNSKDATECCTLLSMLKLSIDTLSSGEAAAHKNAILGCVTTLLGRDESIVNRQRLLIAGNDALLALILKLSEVQLRRVYSSLREWTGDFDKSAPATNAGRRYAFWAISASLAKELRSIFLPCLSMVINDAVAELQVAAQKLVPPEKSVSGSSSNKKRRLLPSDESGGPSYDEYSMRALQPLLLCLERSLRADALGGGGNWVRADGSQRYNAILEPLGKMLRCKIGPDFPLQEGVSKNGFYCLVEGGGSGHDDDGGGNVIGCLVALGLAAGDEQLWKPLNYAVLEACGGGSSSSSSDHGRTEVKRAGLNCLLSLIKTLGEEYMVLLPECLPVLSELLEDSSDEISGKARDAVSMAEELLGESLEDSLR